MHPPRALRSSFFAALVLLIARYIDGVAPARAQAGPAQLSLAEAIELARENNPEYLTQGNQLRAADWNVRNAYGNWLPSIGISNTFGYTAQGERRVDDVRLATQPATYRSSYNLGMSLQLNGSTLLQPSVAKAQARAAEAQFAGAGATLASNVTQQYLTALEAREQVLQAEQELARTEAHVALAEARLEVGTGTPLDVRRAEVQRGQAEVRLLQARNAAVNQVLLLGQILGTRLSADTELTERFELFEPTWQTEGLIEMAMRENPVLRARRAEVDAASTRVRSARSAYLPSVSLSAGVSGFVSQADVSTGLLIEQELETQQARYAGCLEQNQIRSVAGLSPISCVEPDPSVIRSAFEGRDQFPFDYERQPLQASLTVSLPIFNGLGRERQVEEARIARLDAEYMTRAQELALSVQIESALRDVQTAYQTALLQQQVRQTAEEELQLAEERFRFGASTSVEVVDAQASLAEAERAEIAALYGFHRAIAILEDRVGRPLER